MFNIGDLVNVSTMDDSLVGLVVGKDTLYDYDCEKNFYTVDFLDESEHESRLVSEMYVFPA